MSIILKNSMRLSCLRTLPSFHLHCQKSYCTFDDINVENVKAEFCQYEGGSVNLIKNEETGIATITLCHQEKRNAISGSMMCQFSDIITDLEQWSGLGKGRAILLKSEDADYFCSGADLTSTVRKISNPRGGFKLATLMHDNVTRLANLPLLSVCLVRGRAIGGGAELTLSTDFRVFAPSGRLNFVQARLGVLPGWAGGSKLVNLVGRNRALEILLTCRTINADEAVQLGLADAILETGSVEEAEKWICRMISHDCHVTSLVKKVVDKVGQVTMDESLENEKRLFASVWGGEANRKALDGKLKH